MITLVNMEELGRKSLLEKWAIDGKKEVTTQVAQTLFVIYIRDSIALRFEPFKRMYENGSKSCSKGFK